MNESNNEDLYLIWSNEHARWWAPGERGYAPGIVGAGRYTRDDAMRICAHALPTAANIGRISEIPVRLADIVEMCADEVVPSAVLRGRR